MTTRYLVKCVGPQSHSILIDDPSEENVKRILETHVGYFTWYYVQELKTFTPEKPK